jgi:3-hydroxymyristoyl/3-hydroxydecanoyl-(acyl carrier protein) dehydratase
VSDASALREPHIVSVAAEGASVRMELRIPDALCYFEGHFPGRPILPGVVQLTWAIEFGRRHFSLPPRFAQLRNVKFMRVIVPNKHVMLRLDAHGDELSFEYRIGDSTCSSGTVGFSA